MAQAIVSIVAGRLGDLLIQQASFLVGVKDQVEDLRDELMWIQSFLEDVDSRQDDESPVVRIWVSKIRDVAYDIEDIIDTYILKIADEDVLDCTRKNRQVMGSLKKYACICQKGANLCTIGKEVEEIKTRIQKIGDEMKRYGINRKDGGSMGDRKGLSSQDRFQQLRRSSPQDDATLKDIFGLDKNINELVAKLVSDEDQFHSICIAGMGGIGKTTLALKVYNHKEVKRNFECCAWAYVSKDFSAKEVFKRLIKEVKPNLSTEELQEMGMFSEEIYLEEKLRELLKGRKYLVVLDDIWDVEAWESLNKAFPHSKKGRVILTSRNIKVAKESLIHHLQTLNEMESWKLFVVKAFGNDDCPTNLESSGKEMVVKCGGLPLAIIVLAGLLRGKTPQEWFMVRDRIGQQLIKEGQGKNNLEKILSLSYNDLPYQLKACYLHIGLFPEDFEIHVELLIHLWVAEGFIRCGRNDTTLKDVGRGYLNKMINRNMLQVAKQDDLGQIETCRVHDLLREFCISRGQEENFLDYSPRASCFSSSSIMASNVCNARRYAIHLGIERYDFSNLSNSRLRTLLLFNHDRKSLQQQQLKSMSNISLLRVLVLSFVDLQGTRLPDAFGKLIHLRYLRLFYTKAKLPSSIESLQSLQVLDLVGSECHWSDIAIGALSKLTQLRHLLFGDKYWNDLDRESLALPRIGSLANLQTLRPLDALVWKQNEMTNLINLRDLKITKIKASDVDSVLSSITKLDRVQSLELELSTYWSSSEDAFPTLVPLSHCHYLQALILSGKIERLPGDPYHEFPPRLTELKLWNSRLRPEAMTTLEKLPNLMSLSLLNSSFMGKKIVCSGEGFPQLCILKIYHLETEEWEIKERALSKLKRLCILGCYRLKKIPTGLRFVASLQVLELGDMSNEFWVRFDRLGEDAHEIGHIPSIDTSTSSSSRLLEGIIAQKKNRYY